MLRTNGYPGKFISNSTTYTPRRTEQDQGQPPRATVTIPYVAGVSEEIRRVCKDYDVRVAFTSRKTLHSLLTRVKDPLPADKQSMVVYWIPCSCGKVYIGRTILRLETRLKEHHDACSKGQLEKSAVAEYAWTQKHTIRWGDTSVLDSARRHRELLLKEALHIRTTAEGSSFTRDEGAELNECWIAAVRRCEGRNQQQ